LNGADERCKVICTPRGVAHQLEAELRRRAGAPHPDYDTLDLRPLEHRQRRWWKPW
jgi:hypothetical protein